MHVKNQSYLFGGGWGPGVRNLLKRIPTLLATSESINPLGYEGGGYPGPHQLFHLWPSSPRTLGRRMRLRPRERLQLDLTNWVGGKEVRGGEREDQEKLLAGPAWLGPHDFAAASPNISFHGNPGEKRGAFILASEFTLS